MDYKEQIEYLRYLEQQAQHIEAAAFARAARSITDLLARAEAAEACVLELETTHRTEMCEDGYDCTAIGQVRRRLEAAEERAEKAETQMREAKRCVAALSMLLKAIDGKMVMETVLPAARNRMERYREKYPSAKVVLDDWKGDSSI